MGYIETLIEDVNKTHPTLGELIATLQIAVKAKKLVLVVSPSGCGKSTAMAIIAKNTPNAEMPDRLSISGFAKMEDRLSGFRSVLIVEDLTTTGNDYARKATVTALAALVYTHRIESCMLGVEYLIEDFRGAALVGVQPIMLRELMLAPEWDGSVQDKALRYYHLFRPLQPALFLPLVQMEQGINIEKVKDFEPDLGNADWIKLLALADSQWSRARAREHIQDMLRAIAALENREVVMKEDYSLLLRLLKPMAYENLVVVKEQLEGDRQLDNNLLALLVEYATYGGQFALAQIAQDYKITLSQCYKIMQTQADYWQQISKSPTVYVASKKLESQLKMFDLEVNHRDNQVTI